MIVRHASMPSSSGIITSITMTSGCNRSAVATASAPSEASPNDLEATRLLQHHLQPHLHDGMVVHQHHPDPLLLPKSSWSPLRSLRSSGIVQATVVAAQLVRRSPRSGVPPIPFRIRPHSGEPVAPFAHSRRATPPRRPRRTAGWGRSSKSSSTSTLFSMRVPEGVGERIVGDGEETAPYLRR